MNKRYILAFGILVVLLVGMMFVFAGDGEEEFDEEVVEGKSVEEESILSVDNLIEEGVEVENEGISFRVFNEAERDDSGGAYSLQLREGVESFKFGDVEFENIDSSELNEFIFDDDGNLVSVEFTTGEDEGSYKLGKDTCTVPRETYVRYYCGEFVFDSGSVGEIILENDFSEPLVITCGGANIRYLEDGQRFVDTFGIIGDYYFNGHVTLDDSNRITSFYSHDSISVLNPDVEDFSCMLDFHIDCPSSIIIEKYYLDRDKGGTLNFYYEGDFNAEEHSNEDYVYRGENQIILNGNNFEGSFYVNKNTLFGVEPDGGTITLESNGVDVNIFSDGDSSVRIESLVGDYFFEINDNDIYRRVSLHPDSDNIIESDFSMNLHAIEGGDVSSSINYGKGKIISDNYEDYILLQNKLEDVRENKEYLDKPHDYLEERRLLQVTGITRSQNEAYISGVSEFIYGSIDPTVGTSDYNRLENPLNLLSDSSSVYLFEERVKRAPCSEAGWRFYLGLPQEEECFKISSYKPSRGSEDMYYYSASTIPHRFIRDSLFVIGDSEEGVNHVINDPGFEVDLGHITVSKGQDECGSYVSYYDIWDLSPNFMEGFVGKSFEVYDRVYYNPQTLEVIEKVYC
jgi:hypothetical protein